MEVRKSQMVMFAHFSYCWDVTTYVLSEMAESSMLPSVCPSHFPVPASSKTQSHTTPSQFQTWTSAERKPRHTDQKETMMLSKQNMTPVYDVAHIQGQVSYCWWLLCGYSHWATRGRNKWPVLLWIYIVQKENDITKYSTSQKTKNAHFRNVKLYISNVIRHLKTLNF